MDINAINRVSHPERSAKEYASKTLLRLPAVSRSIAGFFQSSAPDTSSLQTLGYLVEGEKASLTMSSPS